MVMETRFDPALVTLSVLVAILASYVALNLANNVKQTKGRLQIIWLGAGALAMGVGIWSMHFIGMLAFEMPGMAMAYDIPLMILSMVVAVVASALALFIVSRETVPIGSQISGGIAMAAAIAGMHYIGMYSMRMEASILWSVPWVVTSVLIALGASFGALFILIRLRDKTDHFWQLLVAGTLMGFAIAGMHYTGMIAATFVHLHDSTGINDSNLLVTTGLTATVIAATLIILFLALAGSYAQRIWSKRNHRAAEMLGKSEEKFRHLVEAVKDYAIFMLDLNGFITTWNLGAQRITGYNEKEIIGKHVSVFYTAEDAIGATTERECRIARDTGHFEGEGLRVRKDGSTYWASVVIAPLFSSDGTLTGFSKVIRDITQFKESEKRMRHLNEELESRVKARTAELAQRERQLSAIANALPALVAQIDQEERVTFANEAFKKWFQLDDDSLIGKTLKEIMGAERYASNEEQVKAALSGQTTVYERLSESGSNSASLGITFTPEFNDAGEVVGFIILASDITKHKEIQAELQNAKEAAEVANAAKSSFLANMSHEIRTPLGVVLGFSELLLDEEMTASERVNSVEVIKRNGRLLSNIINDILDLSKVEAGKLSIERVETPFRDIMNEISSVLSLEAASKGIGLKVISEGRIPGKITTDPLRLRQVLLNIVGNAIKFTSHGSVTITVRMLSSTGGTSPLVFIIKDTGEGIQPEQISRLFTPFTQADSSTTRRFGGTGLGLILSKKLANALGGDVVLSETVPGKGSTFTITIDSGVSDQVIFQNTESSRASNNVLFLSDKKREVDLGNLKILLVDDSPDNQFLVKKILRLSGAQVDTANNGREAVEKALQGDYSVILMDLQMPEMDGYEATSVLRKKGFKKPIIALTAHAMKEERQRTLHSGFDDHITKPVDSEVLINALATYSVADLN